MKHSSTQLRTISDSDYEVAELCKEDCSNEKFTGEIKREQSCQQFTHKPVMTIPDSSSSYEAVEPPREGYSNREIKAKQEQSCRQLTRKTFTTTPDSLSGYEVVEPCREDCRHQEIKPKQEQGCKHLTHKTFTKTPDPSSSYEVVELHREDCSNEEIKTKQEQRQLTHKTFMDGVSVNVLCVSCLQLCSYPVVMKWSNHVQNMRGSRQNKSKAGVEFKGHSVRVL